jgi:regulator of RNase E activity RraA
MNFGSLFDQIAKFDTPTICNALEIARGARFITGFTRERLIAANPKLPPIVGFARTAAIRCSLPFDASARRERLLAYYDYVAQPKQPSVAVIQDIDSQRGLGAFWGEVNTHVHWGLGCVGVVTDGSMRDLDAMHPQFQCLAGTLSPSHGWVQVLEFGKPVDVFGMAVSDGDIVHADQHGAVVIPTDLLGKLPTSIDLMARREKVVLDAAKATGFNVAKLRQAYGEMEKIKT